MSSSLLSSALVIVPVCTSVFISPTRSRWLKVLKETQIRTQQRAFHYIFLTKAKCGFGDLPLQKFATRIDTSSYCPHTPDSISQSRHKMVCITHPRYCNQCTSRQSYRNQKSRRRHVPPVQASMDDSSTPLFTDRVPNCQLVTQPKGKHKKQTRGLVAFCARNRSRVQQCVKVSATGEVETVDQGSDCTSALHSDALRVQNCTLMLLVLMSQRCVLCAHSLRQPIPLSSFNVVHLGLQRSRHRGSVGNHVRPVFVRNAQCLLTRMTCTNTVAGHRFRMVP